MSHDKNSRPIYIASNINDFRLPGATNSNFLNALAELFGIQWQAAEVGETYLGYLLVQDEAIFLGTNRKHKRCRQLFSAAHLLGHYLLEHYNSGRAMICYGFARNQLREMEADTFAEELLMPRDRLIELAELCTPEQITHKLEVPLAVLRRRLDELQQPAR